MRISIMLAIALSAPCSVPAEDPGRIYVYAQRPTAARAWVPISCDAALVAKLKQGKFFVVTVAPGRHVLGIEAGVPLSLDVRSGGESFIRLDWHYEMGGPTIPVLTGVSPEQANKEMRYLSYIDASKVLASSVPKADPRQVPVPRLRRRDQ